MNLTPKQKIFADEYLIDLNATRAYKAAYPSCKKDEAAAVNASKLLRNAKVDSYIQQRMKDRERRTEITQDMVLQELAKVALANGSDFAKVVAKVGYRDVLDKEGTIVRKEPFEYQVVEIVNTDEIPAEKRAAIAGIKQGANGIEIKTSDKVKALELLGRHLGMFNDKMELTGKDSGPIQFGVVALPDVDA